MLKNIELKKSKDLLANFGDVGINLLVFLLAGLLIFQQTVSFPRTLVSLVVLFFLPGFSFQMALYPEKNIFHLKQTIPLSIGLSLVVSG